MLRVFGAERVSVLDGGFAAWRAAGLPVESGAALTEPGVFTPRFRPELVAGIEEVAALTGCLVNALDPATFRGEQETSSYPRRGGIPGSTNLPFSTLLDPDTGCARARDAEEVGLTGGARAITYCGAGIAATLPAFAAFVVDGSEVAVYDGSLRQWTADPTRPVEVG